jgi:hypothetical protein
VACLYTSSASFTTDSMAYAATNELATANGYTRKDMAVTGRTVTLDDTNNHIMYDAGDLTWTAVSGDIGPARYCAFVDTQLGADKYLYVIDFVSDKTANAGTDFKITIDPSGLFRSRMA